MVIGVPKKNILIENKQKPGRNYVLQPTLNYGQCNHLLA